LPQGCSAKREIITDDRYHVYRFLYPGESARFSEVLLGFIAFTNKCAAQVPMEDKGRRRLPKKKSAGTSLFWQHSVFHAFADAELQGCFCGNLNGFASCRIASFARLSVGFHEFSESGKNEFAV
jgi:hypothetical protein